MTGRPGAYGGGVRDPPAGMGQAAERQGRWSENETGPINDTTIGQKESQLGILDKFCGWVLHKLHMKLRHSGVKDRRELGARRGKKQKMG